MVEERKEKQQISSNEISRKSITTARKQNTKKISAQTRLKPEQVQVSVPKTASHDSKACTTNAVRMFTRKQISGNLRRMPTSNNLGDRIGTLHS